MRSKISEFAFELFRPKANCSLGAISETKKYNPGTRLAVGCVITAMRAGELECFENPASLGPGPNLFWKSHWDPEKKKKKKRSFLRS